MGGKFKISLEINFQHYSQKHIDQDNDDDQQQFSSFILGIFRKLEEEKSLVGAEGAT